MALVALATRNALRRADVEKAAQFGEEMLATSEGAPGAASAPRRVGRASRQVATILDGHATRRGSRRASACKKETRLALAPGAAFSGTR